jgi:DNA-binding CsgD family transcriptional regulator
MDTHLFDTLVVGFYRAATGDIPWAEALQGVQVAFDARCCVLQTLDPNTGRLLGLESSPGVDEAVFNYVREYHLIDPRRQYALQHLPEQLGQWVHCHEYLAPGAVAEDRFCQHYLPAYDTRWNSNVTFAVNERVIAGFILELPASRGVLNADEREMARRLGLHMREALLAHERVRRIAAQALAGHGLLQAFAYPMWLLSADRYVLYANTAAEAEQTSESRVALHGRRLVLKRDAPDRLLSQHLQALSRAEHGTGAVLDLRQSTLDAPTWLHLNVLVPSAVMSAFGDQPLVLATLFDPAHVQPLDPFALAQMFSLTPTEARIAALMADGLSAQAMAATHGSTVATVRTHIRQVLHKLGVHRMTDAVRLLRQGEALWARPSTQGSAFS